MSRKNVVPGYRMIDSQDLSTNITSSIVSTKNLDYASIHLEWSGSSPVGTVTVEARNGDSNDWYTLDFGSAISVSGNTGEHQLVFNQLPFSDIRVQYAATSGTGTLSAEITAKTGGA